MGGRAAVVPPWGRQSAARTEGKGPRRVRSTYAIADSRAEVCKSSFAEFLTPPIIPPGGLRIPPVGPKKRISFVLKSIKILIIFWTQFLVDFGSSWVPKLGVGVVFGTFGAQVRPSCVQNASWKLINVKNVNFHETLRLPIPQRFLEPQDGAQNGPRSAQDGPKRLLKTICWPLKIVLKFVLFGVSILVDFGLPNGTPKTW